MTQLPPNLDKTLQRTAETDTDRIVALKDELETTQSALEQEKQKNQILEAGITLYRDNS